MSLLESGLVLRFMKGNLGKGSVTHNDHAARNVIFFAVLKSSVRAVFVHLNEVQRIDVLSPTTFRRVDEVVDFPSRDGKSSTSADRMKKSTRMDVSAGGATCSTSATSSGPH
jgi:hypothetical protein